MVPFLYGEGLHDVSDGVGMTHRSGLALKVAGPSDEKGGTGIANADCRGGAPGKAREILPLGDAGAADPPEGRPPVDNHDLVVLGSQLLHKEGAVISEESNSRDIIQLAPHRVRRPLNEVEVTRGRVEIGGAECGAEDAIQRCEPSIRPPPEIVRTVVDDLRSTAFIHLGVLSDAKRVQGGEPPIRSTEEPAVAAEKLTATRVDAQGRYQRRQGMAK